MMTIGHNHPPRPPRVETDADGRRLMKSFSGGPRRHYRGPYRGLYLTVSGPASASWIFRYMRDGKRHDLGLGSFPEPVTCKRATEKVLETLRLIDEGGDPRGVKLARRAAAGQEAAVKMTFKEASEGFMAAEGRGWSAAHIDDVESKLRRLAYPVLGSMPVASITRADVLCVLKPMWPEKRARDLRQYIAKAFEFARAHDAFTGDNPAAWKGNLAPALGKGRPEVEHLVAMPLSEVPALVASLSQDRDIDRCLGFVVLTVPRLGNAVDMTWDQVNLAERLWTIPKTKNGDALTVPLSQLALALLGEPGEGRVFKCSHDVVTRRLQQLAPHDPAYTMHGFRSVFGGWADKQGYSRAWIEKALGHREKGAVKQAYHRDDLIEERRPMMEEWARACTSPPGAPHSQG
jgi:integrase